VEISLTHLLNSAGHIWNVPRGSGLASTARRIAAGTSALLLACAPALLAQGGGGGTITGRVTDAANGQPITGVNVVVSGTKIGALTGDNGRYTLRGLATGPVSMDVTRIGYSPKHGTATVFADAPVVTDFQLSKSAFSLEAIVTTVTGDQRKVEMANSITQINLSEKIAEMPITTMGSVLSGRSAGVQVNSDGNAGSGSRIRIRGQSSLSLSNDPVVIIDGVRVSAQTNSSAIGVGGSGPSRLDDINPQDIESIEVIKGPSAATLYGTEAANGVISIKTKRGKAGKTKYSVYSEIGRVDDPHKYPDLYAQWGKTPGSTVSRICNLQTIVAGSCVADSLSHGNVLNIDSLTPMSTGSRNQYGVQISGGTDKLQFFISGETENEVGVYKMPQREVTRLLAERGVSALPGEQLRPNALARNSLRANLSAQFAPNWFVQASMGYVNSLQRLPQNNDNSDGLMVAALGGQWRQDLTDPDGVRLAGYRLFGMGDVFAQTTTQGIDRFINSISTQYNPTSWLTTRATAGVDYTARTDNYLNKLNEGPKDGTIRLGNVSNYRAEINQQTVDLGATANFQPRTWLGSKTSVGMQYIRNYVTQTGGSGIGLPPGATTITAAATRNASQSTSEKRTLGYYAEELISVNDKIFFTGGLRRDAASAFGSQFREVFYPKLGASWLISEQDFFHKPSWVSSLRLRGTYGASGQIPGPVDAIRYLSPFSTTLPNGTDASGVTIGSLGNAALKPEYSAETEAGFDLSMFSGASNVELTYYDKKTTDALISRRLAPSLAGVQSGFANIGSIENKGYEVVINQRVIDKRNIAFEFAITGSTNTNRMLTLPPGVSALFTGNRNTQRNQPGYPLYGLWGRSYTYKDANGDGILALSEMTFSDSASYVGPTYPTREMAISPTVELLNHKLRITGQFDSKWGFKKFNNTLRHQCQGGASCRGLYDKSAPLDEQARALAANVNGVFTGFFEDGSFTRFRELAVSYELPSSWARAVKAERWNIILTGRNLHVWTKYDGVDPEATVGNSDVRGNEEYFSTAPMRYFTFRMLLSF
jgi:TonB-linked SusC/RagA family outer membrane protein